MTSVRLTGVKTAVPVGAAAVAVLVAGVAVAATGAASPSHHARAAAAVPPTADRLLAKITAPSGWTVAASQAKIPAFETAVGGGATVDFTVAKQLTGPYGVDAVVLVSHEKTALTTDEIASKTPFVLGPFMHGMSDPATASIVAAVAGGVSTVVEVTPTQLLAVEYETEDPVTARKLLDAEEVSTVGAGAPLLAAPASAPPVSTIPEGGARSVGGLTRADLVNRLVAPAGFTLDRSGTNISAADAESTFDGSDGFAFGLANSYTGPTGTALVAVGAYVARLPPAALAQVTVSFVGTSGNTHVTRVDDHEASALEDDGKGVAVLARSDLLIVVEVPAGPGAQTQARALVEQESAALPTG